MRLMNDVFGNEGALEIIKNPFEFKYIDAIHIHSIKSGISDEFWNTASVEFTNGSTKGAQTFKGKTLDEVFIQVYNFCKELNNR